MIEFIPKLNEFRKAVKHEANGEGETRTNPLINVLHQKYLDDNDVIELVLSFDAPVSGYEPGDIQGISNLTDDREFTANDLDEDDIEQIRRLFADSVMAYNTTRDGVGNKDFPEFEEYEKEKLVGGKGDDLKVSDVDQKELTMGIAVEAEHTSDPSIAADIAMDHLAEKPNYYSLLISKGIADEKSAINLFKKLIGKKIEEGMVNEAEGPHTKIFITDMGVSVDVKNPAGELSFTIPRYGVWSIKNKQKPNVIETSDNLDMLLGKYKLTETDVIKLFNNEQQVSEGVVGHDRKTHGKQSLKNLLYTRMESLTSGLFSDNDWRHVRKVFDLFNELGLDWHLTDAYYGSAKHDKTFPPTRKQWNFEIVFPTDGGGQETINGYLVAAGAGSTEDPLDRYDITVVVN